MSTIYLVAAALLAGATVMAFVRLVRGPSVLDRAVSLDVVIAILMSVVAAEAAFNRHQTSLSILAVLSVVGFIGSVTLARFATRRGQDR